MHPLTERDAMDLARALSRTRQDEIWREMTHEERAAAIAAWLLTKREAANAIVR